MPSIAAPHQSRQQFLANDSDSHQRLDLVVCRYIPELTRSKVKTLIETKSITINGVVAKKAGLLLEEGDLIEVLIPDRKSVV